MLVFELTDIGNLQFGLWITFGVGTFKYRLGITVKYLVSAHYHVSAHPLLLD